MSEVQERLRQVELEQVKAQVKRRESRKRLTMVGFMWLLFITAMSVRVGWSWLQVDGTWLLFIIALTVSGLLLVTLIFGMVLERWGR